MAKFPQNFLWGAATSSYQVEGNNLNADWWHWEKKAGKQNSGLACRHYDLFEQDFDLAASLNHNALRLSIEWSRIEPEEGKFCQAELEHYLEVIASLRRHKLEPIVTLHHFTNPQWFAKIGGWLDSRAIGYFKRYCQYVVEALAPSVNYWITINEPLVYTYHAYILGVWPPQEISLFKSMRVENNFTLAHIEIYKLIQDIYKKRGLFLPRVSIAQNLQAFVACRPCLKDKFAAYLRDRWYNFGMIDRLSRHKTLDFIGINYYSRQLVEAENWGLRHLLFDTCKKNHHPLEKNSLGWDIYPEGLYDLLLKLKKYNLDVMITENGICTEDDNLRWKYIYEHLKNIQRARDNGVKVLGYIYWSLIDNFEWDKGFAPRFGLVEVDYNTFTRTVRGSAKKFAEICLEGEID